MVEGTQVGAYRILRQIGEGGMGSVWLAEHAMLGRRAAIKVLHPEYSQREEIVARFFNEARAATRVTDPGIVQIFDFGHHSDGSAYIAMELLDGESLDRRLERLGALAVPDALRIMRQASSTLGAAHAHGIIHRDLKPENIYIVPDPEVPGGERAKILDFGIAKLTGDVAPSSVKTQASAIMGTPTYMSPEQCRGAGQVDQRSDVYALGCVLFTLLTGRPPFVADGMGALLVAHMSEAPPVPSSVRQGIPPEVDALVLRCLAKHPGERFASGGELAIAIGVLTGSSPGLGFATPGRSGGYVAAKSTTLSAAAGASTPTAAPARGGRMFAVVGIGVALVAGVVAFAATRGGDHAAAPPTVTPPPAPAPAPPVPTPAPVVVPKPDPNAEVSARMTEAVARFVAWSKQHAGAACPDGSVLGDAKDPWGRPFQITCTDQPGDQVVGLVSAGADGVVGTGDDIASWRLDRGVTEPVRGARWTVAAPVKVPVKSPVKSPPKLKTTQPSGGVQLDENGLPISR